MIVTNHDKTVRVRTVAGVQLPMYVRQLREAGILPTRARNELEARRIRLDISRLVQFMRHGEVSTRSREVADRLGLRIYPEGTPL